MITARTFEAKTRLASKHGTPVARLVPIQAAGPDRACEAIARLRTFREGQTLGSLRAKDHIGEGRR